MAATAFPILGTEPPVVEFANTLYGDGDRRIDFLDTAARIEEWFALVPLDGGVTAPAGVMGRHGERVRAARDCVRALLCAAADGRGPGRAAVERLNDLAAAAPTYPRLEWTPGAAPAVRRLDTVAGAPALLGSLASGCAELLAGPEPVAVRRCPGPGCSMLFVRGHPRRRWCHPSCGHRDRQARFYRRHLARRPT
ncbi:MAG: hypothetical protein K0R62_6451 [Nonomuraea muscovyensis]|nr:hypothetical protein [Nonomuraea muscovyensis]